MQDLGIKTITIHKYKCDYCSRNYRIKSACAEHEDKCYKNPNRNCPMCDNEGGEFWQGAMVQPCSFCNTAEELGGKSYVPKKY